MTATEWTSMNRDVRLTRQPRRPFQHHTFIGQYLYYPVCLAPTLTYAPIHLLVQTDIQTNTTIEDPMNHLEQLHHYHQDTPKTITGEIVRVMNIHTKTSTDTNLASAANDDPIICKNIPTTNTILGRRGILAHIHLANI